MDVYVAAKAHMVAGLLARAREERQLEPATYWIPDSRMREGNETVPRPGSSDP